MSIEEVRGQLEAVAKELNLPLNDKKVSMEWCRRGGWYSNDIFVNLIVPLYYPDPKYICEWNEEIHCPTVRLNPDYKETPSLKKD